MPQYLYQAAYTPESLAAQMKNPADRLAQVGEMVAKSVGAKILAGGFSYGDYDIAVILEADSNRTAAAIAVAIASGGAVKSAKTTPLLSGDEWIETLKQASSVTYTPAK
ncbi:GYD domain-containing protein [Candidatus Lucifugimonas marina]|uniref:GYD domain-containing protein n=1 Tax=Candidatus Lucifugimonas marina TaxID=3038979 RepID=A0AAJ6CSC8_9CHLR|nr:GYD domain-containing protein [SAR202 cluster bacterium JH1073]